MDIEITQNYDKSVDICIERNGLSVVITIEEEDYKLFKNKVIKF